MPLPEVPEIPLEREFEYIQRAELIVNEACEPVIKEMAARLIRNTERELSEPTRPINVLRFLWKNFWGNQNIPDVGNNFEGHNIKEWTAVQDPSFDVRG